MVYDPLGLLGEIEGKTNTLQEDATTPLDDLKAEQDALIEQNKYVKAARAYSGDMAEGGPIKDVAAEVGLGSSVMAASGSLGSKIFSAIAGGKDKDIKDAADVMRAVNKISAEADQYNNAAFVGDAAQSVGMQINANLRSFDDALALGVIGTGIGAIGGEGFGAGPGFLIGAEVGQVSGNFKAWMHQGAAELYLEMLDNDKVPEQYARAGAALGSIPYAAIEFAFTKTPFGKLFQKIGMGGPIVKASRYAIKKAALSVVGQFLSTALKESVIEESGQKLAKDVARNLTSALAHEFEGTPLKYISTSDMFKRAITDGVTSIPQSILLTLLGGAPSARTASKQTKTVKEYETILADKSGLLESDFEKRLKDVGGDFDAYEAQLKTEVDAVSAREAAAEKLADETEKAVTKKRVDSLKSRILDESVSPEQAAEELARIKYGDELVDKNKEEAIKRVLGGEKPSYETVGSVIGMDDELDAKASASLTSAAKRASQEYTAKRDLYKSNGQLTKELDNALLNDSAKKNGVDPKDVLKSIEDEESQKQPKTEAEVVEASKKRRDAITKIKERIEELQKETGKKPPPTLVIKEVNKELGTDITLSELKKAGVKTSTSPQTLDEWKEKVKKKTPPKKQTTTSNAAAAQGGVVDVTTPVVAKKPRKGQMVEVADTTMDVAKKDGSTVTVKSGETRINRKSGKKATIIIKQDSDGNKKAYLKLHDGSIVPFHANTNTIDAYASEEEFSSENIKKTKVKVLVGEVDGKKVYAEGYPVNGPYKDDKGKSVFDINVKDENGERIIKGVPTGDVYNSVDVKDAGLGSSRTGKKADISIDAPLSEGGVSAEAVLKKDEEKQTPKSEKVTIENAGKSITANVPDAAVEHVSELQDSLVSDPSKRVTGNELTKKAVVVAAIASEAVEKNAPEKIKALKEELQANLEEDKKNAKTQADIDVAESTYAEAIHLETLTIIRDAAKSGNEWAKKALTDIYDAIRGEKQKLLTGASGKETSVSKAKINKPDRTPKQIFEDGIKSIGKAIHGKKPGDIVKFTDIDGKTVSMTAKEAREYALAQIALNRNLLLSSKDSKSGATSEIVPSFMAKKNVAIAEKQIRKMASIVGGTISGALNDPNGMVITTRNGDILVFKAALITPGLLSIDDKGQEIQGSNTVIYDKNGKPIGWQILLDPDTMSPNTIWHEGSAGHVAFRLLDKRERKLLVDYFNRNGMIEWARNSSGWSFAGEATDEIVANELMARTLQDNALEGKLFEDLGPIRRIWEKFKELVERLSGGLFYKGAKVLGTERREAMRIFNDAISGKTVRERKIKPLGQEDLTNLSSSYHGGWDWKPEPGFPHGRPRLDKIRSGEGAMRWGWGFYIAEAKGTGESYFKAADSSTRRLEVKFHGMSVNPPVDNGLPLRNPRNRALEYVRMEGSVEGAIKSLRSNQRDWSRRLDYLQEYERKNIDGIEDATQWLVIGAETIEWLNNNGQDITVSNNKSAALNRLEIPDDLHQRMLHLDDKLSEQPEYVFNALKSSPILYQYVEDAKKSTTTGWQLYEELVNRTRAEKTQSYDIVGPAMKRFAETLGYASEDSISLNAKEIVSKYLLQYGIVGNRYKDQESRYKASQFRKDVAEGRYRVYAWIPRGLKTKEYGIFDMRVPPIFESGTRYTDSTPIQTFRTKRDAEDWLNKVSDGMLDTYNAVIWDQKSLDRISVLERNGKPLDDIRRGFLQQEEAMLSGSNTTQSGANALKAFKDKLKAQYGESTYRTSKEWKELRDLAKKMGMTLEEAINYDPKKAGGPSAQEVDEIERDIEASHPADKESELAKRVYGRADTIGIFNLPTMAKFISDKFHDVVQKKMRESNIRHAKTMLTIQKILVDRKGSRIFDKMKNSKEVDVDVGGLFKKPVKMTFAEYAYLQRLAMSSSGRRAIMNGGYVGRFGEKSFELREQIDKDTDKLVIQEIDGKIKEWAERENVGVLKEFNEMMDEIFDKHLYPKLAETYRELFPGQVLPPVEHYIQLMRIHGVNTNAKGIVKWAQLLKDWHSFERRNVNPNPIIVTSALDSVHYSMIQASRVYGYAGNLRYLRQLLGDKGDTGKAVGSMAYRIDRALGEGATDRFLDALNHVEGLVDKNDLKALRWIIRQQDRSRLSGPGTILKQLAALTVPLVKYDYDVVFGGLSSEMPKALKDKILKSDMGAALLYRLYEGLAIDEINRATSGGAFVDSRIDKISYAGMRWADKLTVDKYLDIANKHVEKYFPGLKGDERINKIAEVATDMVNEFQPAGYAEYRTALHNKGILGIILNRYRTSVNAIYNTIVREYINVRRNPSDKNAEKRFAASVTAAVLSQTTYFAAVDMFLKWSRDALWDLFTENPEDDDDEKRGKLATWAVGVINNTVSQLPLAGLYEPIIRLAADFFTTKGAERSNLIRTTSERAASQMNPLTDVYDAFQKAAFAAATLQRLSDKYILTKPQRHAKRRAWKMLADAAIQFTSYGSPLPAWNRALNLTRFIEEMP